MPLVAGKCPNCGAPIEVDNSSKAWLCEFCNTPIITEEAITNYNITNNIQANTVIVQGKDINTLLKTIECQIEDNCINEANKTINEAMGIDPNNALLNLFALMTKYGIFNRKYLVESVFVLRDTIINSSSFQRALDNATGNLKVDLEKLVRINQILSDYSPDKAQKLNEIVYEMGFYVYGNALKKKFSGWAGDPDSPLLWRILDEKDDRMLLFCSRALYYGVDYSTWEYSGICDFLNGKYAWKQMYTSEELSRVIPVDIQYIKSSVGNKFFILNREEAERYFRTDLDRITTSDSEYRSWHLRWGLVEKKKKEPTYRVDENGAIAKGFLKVGIRPAVWIKK